MLSGTLRALRATQVLDNAMNLPGVRTALTPQQRARVARRVVEPTVYERASVYLLLAEVGRH